MNGVPADAAGEVEAVATVAGSSDRIGTAGSSAPAWVEA